MIVFNDHMRRMEMRTPSQERWSREERKAWMMQVEDHNKHDQFKDILTWFGMVDVGLKEQKVGYGNGPRNG